MRVLLVDDNADHRFLVRRVLAQLAQEGRALELSTAADGEEALERLGAADPLPDLVVLDVKMPRRDGFETLRALRAAPRTSRLRVVMFSSSENAADLVRAQELGADGFVTKPLDARGFQEAVRALVARFAPDAPGATDAP